MTRTEWLHPPALRKGARIAVVAPSGPVPIERFERGLLRLSTRYRPEMAPGILEQRGFLAGSDGRRLAELRWALSDPSIDGVICARGGYGALRYLPALAAIRDEDLRAAPLIGFSDITVLHALFSERKRVCIHGPVVTQLGELPDEDVEALWSLLEDPSPPPPIDGLVRASEATRPVAGRLLGGNLELLSRLVGTLAHSALCAGEPVVLLLEEVGESPYRIDRALTQLELSGALRNVAAVIVGDLVRCEPPAGSSHPSPLTVIAAHFAPRGVPVLAGAPIGHGARNRAVALGTRVEVDSRSERVVFLEGAAVRR